MTNYRVHNLKGELSKLIIVRGLTYIHKTVNQEVLENFSSKTLLRRFQKQAKLLNQQSKTFFYYLVKPMLNTL